MEVSCEVMDGWERRAWCGESFLSISCAWFYRLAVQPGVEPSYSYSYCTS